MILIAKDELQGMSSSFQRYNGFGLTTAKMHIVGVGWY